MNNKYINSKILFYQPEIIIFCLYFVVYCFASVKEHGFLFAGLMFGGVSFVFFIIEHRTDLIFDKVNNIVIVREKMLFFNNFIVKKQYTLSDVIKADVWATTEYDSKEGIDITRYKLRLLKKDNDVIFPFGGWSDNVHKKWQDMADKINDFNQSKESTLLITRKPFFFRLSFGILFGFFYFLFALGIIFPKEMNPIIYHTLNVLFSLTGFHQ